MASCVLNTVKAEIQAVTDGKDGYCLFNASGFSVKFDGYTALYEESTDEEEEDASKLPELSEGDKLKLKELLGNQHFTQPPSRYTEASLIKALEENGIGRPSTYATIISTIVKREYIKRQQKQLTPTELGEAITSLLKDKFPKIVNTKFTAGMETNLDEVGEGKLDYIAMLHEFYDDFDNTLQKAKADMKDVKIQLEEDMTDIPCEKCGRMMVIKKGRFGKFLACPGYPECKNAKPLVMQTNAKCPKCGGEVIEKKSKKGYTFYGCGNWPNCDFMTWDKPTDDKCPQCGKSLFKRKGGLTVCLDEACGYEKKTERKSRKKAEE
jgi:DNA topoisomerase-1